MSGIAGPLVETCIGGACEPTNPGGHGATGVVVKVNDQIRHAASHYCGSGVGMSNNVAEYQAAIAALEWIDRTGLAQTARTIRVYSDSQLLVHQLRGEWAARAGAYLPYYAQARDLLADLARRCSGAVEVRWIPRTANREADALTRQEFKARGIPCRNWRSGGEAA